MKIFFYTIFAIVTMNSISFAQNKKIEAVSAKIENNNLVINWTNAGNTDGNWEVQGSTDGRNFSIIGMVMGQDPSNKNEFKFKQTVSKIKPGLKYYRVLLLETTETATASKVFRISK